MTGLPPRCPLCRSTNVKIHQTGVTPSPMHLAWCRECEWRGKSKDTNPRFHPTVRVPEEKGDE